MVEHYPRFLQLVNDIKGSIKECDIFTVKKKLDARSPFFLIDVREQSEWANGHLPEAIYLGKGIIERDIESVLPDLDSEIVLYCGGGFRSALAASNLGRMGYTNVKSMDGGFRSWTEAHFPIVNSASKSLERL